MTRRARVDDARGIAAVHVASWRAAYVGLIPQEELDGLDVEERTLVWRERIESAGEQTWVVEEDGEVAGFCHLRRSEDPDDDPVTAEIAMLYLVPTAWGKGYGRALMQAALEAARETCVVATLWVLEGNGRARRFYEAGGWRDDGRRKDCFGGVAAPAVCYRLPLT